MDAAEGSTPVFQLFVGQRVVQKDDVTLKLPATLP
jgi:hypothetical protein